MNDLGKIAVVAGILGALLLFGLFMNPSDRVAVDPVPVVVGEPVVETIVLPQQSLEMLDPIYSEKAVFHDKTIRIAFQAAFTEDGVESRLPFWIHNVSDDVINILWDRCSIQLPTGNTVKVIHEGALDVISAVSQTISIAPAGDLFDAFIPVTEIGRDDEGMTITSNVLTEGTFTLVLAIERAATEDCEMRQQGMSRMTDNDCEADDMHGKRETACKSAGREIAYYTFRFVLR